MLVDPKSNGLIGLLFPLLMVLLEDELELEDGTFMLSLFPELLLLPDEIGQTSIFSSGPLLLFPPKVPVVGIELPTYFLRRQAVTDSLVFSVADFVVTSGSLNVLKFKFAELS